MSLLNLNEWSVTLVISGWLILASGAACSDDIGCKHQQDDVLSVGDLQMKGTHNSYHLKPEYSGIVYLDYSHAPLNVQLAELGVRQFELDVYHDVESGRFDVQHEPDLDPNTNCSPLVECLGLMKEWSDANPAHHPIFVLIELKDFFVSETVESYFQELEGKILSVWPAKRLITPAMVQADYPSLRQAIQERGWPVLGEVRGRIMFILFESGEYRSHYTHGDIDLDDRLMFARVSYSDNQAPYASIVIMNDPLEELERIQEVVAAGFLVRTRADNGIEPREPNYSRLNAALESGAHFISTDFPGPNDEVDYQLDIPGGTPSRCNPVTASATCTSLALENPDCIFSRP